MVIFQDPEWSNFLGNIKKRPLEVLFYFLDLIKFLLLKTSHRLRSLWREWISPHQGLKRWPHWLGTRAFPKTKNNARQLIFPDFPPARLEPLNPKAMALVFQSQDPEKILARHRWHDCVWAVLVNQNSAPKALCSALRWIRNPPSIRTPAWEPYSTSERIANLATLLSVFPKLYAESSRKDQELLADFFLTSGKWVHDHLEYYEPERTNNHILNNARALVICGAVLGNRKLVARGLYLFTRMAGKMFSSSGVLRERSSHYQLVVANWVADIAKFRRLNVENKIVKFKSPIDKLARNAGRIALILSDAAADFGSHIGDISPDYHPRLSRERLRHLYPEYASQSQSSRYTCLDDWILGHSAPHAFMACRFPNNYPLKYPTHGHCDLGHFLWACDRQPVLIDRGRGTYGSEKPGISQYQAKAHNTLVLNELPALAETFFVRGRWLPKPYVSASIKFLSNATGIRIEHNGFSRIQGVKNHLRSVSFLKEKKILVADKLCGDGYFFVEQFWHFSRDWQPAGERILKNQKSGSKLEIYVEGAKSVPTFRWEKSSYSTCYGDWQTCGRLVVSNHVRLPATLRTHMKII